MATFQPQLIPQESRALTTPHISVNDRNPVVLDKPKKISYKRRFPKRLIIALSIIQLTMAALSITTNVLGVTMRYPHPFHNIGVGIWTGIFFGLSGIFGLVASCNPTLGYIVTLMVFSIIAALFSLPLLILSPLGTADTKYCSHRCYNSEIRHAMFVIQIVISLIQFAAAMASSAMSCKAICMCYTCCICCRCCRTIETDRSDSENDLVNYRDIELGIRRSHSKRSQGSYIATAVRSSQVPTTSGGATSLREGNSSNMLPLGSPPRYEAIARLEEEADSILNLDSQVQES